MKGVILCAGRGERLKPLTDNLPKPLIPVGDKPLLNYNFGLFKKHGVNKIYINTSYMAEKIKNLFGDGKQFGININYSFESELLGTAGALNNFRSHLSDETFVVLYGDNLTDINLTEMISFHKNKKAIATLFLQREKMADRKTTPGVVIVNPDSTIKAIIERPTREEQKQIDSIPPNLKYNNSGVYILEPEVLDFIPEGFSDFAKDIFPLILSKNKIMAGYLADCFFRELGALNRYELTIEEVKKGKLNSLLKDLQLK